MILAMFLFQMFSVLQLIIFFFFKEGWFSALLSSEALFQDEYSDRGLVLGIFLHSRACCTYSSNVQRSDLYFSVGYSEYPPSPLATTFLRSDEQIDWFVDPLIGAAELWCQLSCHLSSLSRHESRIESVTSSVQGVSDSNWAKDTSSQEGDFLFALCKSSLEARYFGSLVTLEATPWVAAL